MGPGASAPAGPHGPQGHLRQGAVHLCGQRGLFPARRCLQAGRRYAPGRAWCIWGSEPVWPVAAAKCDEVMPFPLPSREGRLSPGGEEPIRRRAGACDAVLVGCGLGRGPGCDAPVRRLLDLDRPWCWTPTA
ncbi:MAG: hypothetical protein ACLU38_05305 [Dysosmobacter sp.]